MANIIRFGCSNSGEETPTLDIFEGKINSSDGTIIEDSDHYYTDKMSCPQGTTIMDFGSTYDGSDAIVALYDSDNSFIDYWSANSRYRHLSWKNDYQEGRYIRLMFPKTALSSSEFVDLSCFKIYSGNSLTEAVLIGGSGGGGGSITYKDLTNLDNYFNRNTTTPVITHVDNDMVDIDFTINNWSGYEGATVSVPLDKGIYVCEFDIALGTTTVQSTYGWGVYTTYDNSIAQSYERNYTNSNQAFNTYVPFEVTTSKQHIKVPVKMTSNGTAYICFSLADIDTSTADVSIENLKIYS